MTVATVTICGVVIEAGDIPQSPYFITDVGRPIFTIHDPYGQWPDTKIFEYLDELETPVLRPLLPIVAAFARCWFLDRAEELGGKGYSKIEEYVTNEHAKERYLASAAKWAQIGRNAK